MTSEELSQGAERARPLGRDARSARRDGRPRQHRRQRERPAGHLAAKGQPSAENTWNLDGMVITDMSATGASPTYFDFGAFQEITVTTGGTDLAMATGGAGINLTTRRGTNAFHGSARYMVADEDMSSATSTTRPVALHAQRLRGSALRNATAPTATRATASRRSPTTASTSAARSSRTSSGSTAATASRTSSCCGSRHSRQHAAPLVQRQAELAGHGQHDGVGLLLPGQQAEVRPLAGQRPGHRRGRASSGTRTTPTPTAGFRAASGSCRSTTPSRPTSSSR